MIFLGLCLATSSALGQIATTGLVRGRILVENGTPVRGALVALVGRAESARTLGTGEFVFQRVPAGFHTLQIRALGYVQKSQDIRVVADSGWVGSIVLVRVPQSLPEVQVAASKPPEFLNTTKYDDYFRRRRLGFGTFRTRDDFEKMGAVDIVSTLQNIPGVNISATANPNGEPEVRFRMARCPGQPPRLGVYINGLRVALFGKNSENKGSELSRFGLNRQTEKEKDQKSTCEDCARLGEVLSSVPLSEILFVEFYRGPGQIPSDLDRGDSCAALVIWTRDHLQHDSTGASTPLAAPVNLSAPVSRQAVRTPLRTTGVIAQHGRALEAHRSRHFAAVWRGTQSSRAKALRFVPTCIAGRGKLDSPGRGQSRILVDSQVPWWCRLSVSTTPAAISPEASLWKCCQALSFGNIAHRSLEEPRLTPRSFPPA